MESGLVGSVSEGFPACSVYGFLHSAYCFLKTYSLIYRTHPQSLLVLWPCYVITYVKLGISFEEM